MLAHLLPIPLLLVLPLGVALPVLFLTGAGYSVWLGRMVYSLRAQRKQFQFEFSFFIVMAVLAVTVVILGFSIAYIDDAWFYYFYTGAIGVGFAIMTVALIVNPDLLGESPMPRGPDTATRHCAVWTLGHACSNSTRS